MKGAKVNSGIADSRFVYKPPEGVEVVSREEFGMPWGLSEEEKLVGEKASDFKLKDLGGKTVSLSGFRGKVLLLDFWSTWCGPCVEELPELQKIYEKYRGQGFEVIGVNLQEDEERVKSFVKEKGVNVYCAFGQ